MNQSFIFLPSVALVALAYVVLLYMFFGRIAGIKKHRARVQSLADPAREAEVFAEVANPSDNFENLFEMPVLFFVASIIIFVLQKVDHSYLTLAWLYVFFRFLHSYIHCTSNHVRSRFNTFFLSVVVLIVIWGRIAIQILS